jgi:hypothetical protein
MDGPELRKWGRTRSEQDNEHFASMQLGRFIGHLSNYHLIKYCAPETEWNSPSFYLSVTW